MKKSLGNCALWKFRNPGYSIRDSRDLKIFISFSMGKSSAEAIRRIMSDFPLAKKVVIIANTGQEREESLFFADRVDKEFALNAIWVEAVVHPGEEKASTHRVVTFETASRKGEPYRDVIAKYGLPNVEYLHCTRELKTNPMYSYIESLGWKWGEYVVALGIRADEPQRLSLKAAELGLWYPLAELGVDKSEVNCAWDSMPFNLELEEFEGNCSWCFKKSDMKHVANIQKNPHLYDFPAEMERLYSNLKADALHPPRKIFRKNRTTKDMLGLAKGLPNNPQRKWGDRDEDSGCTESCEAEGI